MFLYPTVILVTVYDKAFQEKNFLQFLQIFANCECFTTENFPSS